MVFLLLLAGCYYDNEEELYPGETCDVTEISYQVNIRPIIDANCALSGCHVPQTGRVNFESFEGLKSVADDGRLEQRALINKDMPPSGPISSCDMKMIKAWLDQGAPNN